MKLCGQHKKLAIPSERSSKSAPAVSLQAGASLSLMPLRV